MPLPLFTDVNNFLNKNAKEGVFFPREGMSWPEINSIEVFPVMVNH